MARAAIAVRVEETLDDGVVVAGLEVIEARLGVEIIASVAKGVNICKAAGGAQDASIGIISITCHRYPGGVDQVEHIPLEVQNVVIGCRRRSAGRCFREVQHIRPAALVVEEIQLIGNAALGVGLTQKLTGGVDVVVPDAVHDLVGSQTVYVVVIADAVGPVACRCQLPPVLPGHGPGGQVAYIEEAGGVARAVVGT